jgi:hypothetical protein
MFRDYFDKVFFISLGHREDRRNALRDAFERFGLVDPNDVEWVRAVDGRLCPSPEYFSAGGGAWGCYQTHLRIVQDAAMDGLESYLVIEDDAIFSDHSADLLKSFMDQVPGDWDQLFLGGQHVEDPEIVPFRPMVLKATSVTRTHAFALRNTAFNIFQQHIAAAPDYISNGEWHVDHQIGLAHQRELWKTYVPAWWISGQDGGESNIANQDNPPLWWHWKQWATDLPFIYLRSDQESSQALKSQVHFGNHLGGSSYVSKDLGECLRGNVKLSKWLQQTADEALSKNQLPGICHPEIPIEKVESEWGNWVVDSVKADLAKLIEYPFNGLFRHPVNRLRERSRESFLRLSSRV